MGMPNNGARRLARARHAETALRLSEATRVAILDTALDCIVTIDHTGSVLDWNPAAERTFGYMRTEAVGRQMADLIIPEAMRPMHRAGLARAVATGQDHMAGRRMEMQAQRKDGSVIPVELAITRISAGERPLFTGHIRDISERKASEHALQQSQQLLASITGNLTEAIFRRFLDQGLIFANEAYVRMFGYETVEQLVNVPSASLYADPARRAQIVSLLQLRGAFRNEEIEYRRRDGTTFWGLTSATGIRAETGGNIQFYDGAITDVTGQKHRALRQAAQYAVARALAESALLDEAAQRVLQVVCESLHWDVGSVWELDENGQTLRSVEFWHRPGLRLTPFKKATRLARIARGIGLPGRVWQTGRPVWISDVSTDGNFPRAGIATKCGLHAAFGVPLLFGRKFLGMIEFFSREIREPDADLLEMFAAIGSQIGQFMERSHAETEIRRLNKNLESRVAERTRELTAANAAASASEDRYRTVIEHAPSGVVLLDPQAGLMVDANENALRLFGVTREQLLRLGPEDVSPEYQPDGEPSAKAARKKIQKALRGDSTPFEWTHRHASGATVPCEIRLARMPATARGLLVGTVVDITQRKKAETELRDALNQEKELNQLKTNFVGVVSHEFRTPLGVIMSSADILENYGDRLKPDQRIGHLRDIVHSTRQMATLMEEVLLLGRVESGRMECKPEPTDLADLCRRLVEEQLSVTATKCPVSLDVCGLDAPAQCDEALIRHILGNLISNAVKYSQAGSPVLLLARRRGVEAVFEIRDQGIGIPEADQKHLFQTFHRGQNVGETPGTGLGLTIVKRCVELHGGTVEVSSRLGVGTTFVVRLNVFGPPPKTNKPGKLPSNPKKR